MAPDDSLRSQGGRDHRFHHTALNMVGRPQLPRTPFFPHVSSQQVTVTCPSPCPGSQLWGHPVVGASLLLKSTGPHLFLFLLLLKKQIKKIYTLQP